MSRYPITAAAALVLMGVAVGVEAMRDGWAAAASLALLMVAAAMVAAASGNSGGENGNSD